MILVIFTGCSRVEEIAEGVNEVKNTYDDVKEQVDDVLEVVEDSNLDLDSLDTEKLGEVIDGAAKITGKDIDLEEIENIEDISSFGEYNATEFISRNEESIRGGYFTDYYSSADFEEVVSYYRSILSNTVDFELLENPNANYAEISAIVNNAFLKFSISQNDEGDTYIFYEYDVPNQVIDNEASVIQADYISAFNVFHDKQIEIFETDPNTIIKEEIGELDFNQIQEDWDVGYHQNIYMSLTITSTGVETGTFTSTADVFIKGDNINMTMYTEHGEITAIYNANRNETYYENSMAVGSDTETGCALPFRLLDLGDFRYMENNVENGEFMPQYTEDPRDGSWSALIWFFEGDTWGFISYDLDKRIIDAYSENGMEMIYNDAYPEGKEFPYGHHWVADEIKTDIEIKDDLFTW